jgi:hypothetical protein
MVRLWSGQLKMIAGKKAERRRTAAAATLEHSRNQVSLGATAISSAKRSKKLLTVA